MASAIVSDVPQAGFSFENCKRNAFLFEKGMAAPKVTKTGTTICGVIFKDGVVLGADTRSTGGDLVADKNCEKIHKMARNMMCCGAGTAADCSKTTATMASQLELHRLNTGRQTRVCTANRMLKQMLFRYQGYIGAYLVLGGVDVTGPHLYTVAAHGSTDCLPFVAMGSGMLAAMAVLEMRWKPDMEEEDAKKLVRDAIAGGIFNDLGSGSNVDLAVIKANDQIEYLRGYEIANVKGKRSQSYKYRSGTTEVLSTFRRPIVVEEVSVRPVAMDTT
eukprot:maker-scaffold1571_size35388-snap-gene-0.8 protein:Tk07365 transcript:maker-scaffold1571_size35388-snap-gene-0.8-mRNA-1 annotation:"proteasome subunit beta type 7 precursor"